MKSEMAKERLEHDTREDEALLNFLQINCPITDLNRIGNFEKGKTRTVVIALANEHQKRLVLSSVRKLAEYMHKIHLTK